ncbi:uncharacterized protein LOC142334878 [Convolutriloba macropyga]|uniref:uncharacterized protein LOC142334878 n=1 Tax=Convolutriloba macropyga TaxID=536237 RepID=UPI003F5245D0
MNELCANPLVQPYSLQKEATVATDASENAVGGVLYREDGCVKFLRYDNTYLQVGEPWIFPCSSPITASAKSDRWILLGQQNGDVRLISIRLQGEETSDEGKRRVSANMAALYSDNRRRKVTAVALYQSIGVVQIEGCSLLVLHIDYTDIPPRLALSNQIEASIMHPSLYMEIEMVHFNVYNQQGDLLKKVFINFF